MGESWLQQKTVTAAVGYGRRGLRQRWVTAEVGYGRRWFRQKMVTAEEGYGRIGLLLNDTQYSSSDLSLILNKCHIRLTSGRTE